MRADFSLPPQADAPDGIALWLLPGDFGSDGLVLVVAEELDSQGSADRVGRVDALANRGIDELSED